MIENSEVETLIVKDLSRLGREYLQVGQLTELYFPEKGVRFIAVNDSVDSLVESSNDFMYDRSTDSHENNVRQVARMQPFSQVLIPGELVQMKGGNTNTGLWLRRFLLEPP